MDEKFVSLGIDTSNYRTSAAVFGSSAAHKRELLPVKNGSLGLRQSEAVFLHTKALPNIIKELITENGVDFNTVKSIGVSAYPRDELNSYMPCFLVGKSAGEILSAVYNIPLYNFSHQCGHIAAAVYSAQSDFKNETEETEEIKEIKLSNINNIKETKKVKENLKLLKEKFIAMHISGGTTECLLVTPGENIISCKKIAGTLDLNAGQVIDRIGVKLGFDFPSGIYLEKFLNNNFNYIKTKPAFKNGCCCLSGLENKCNELIFKKDKIYAVSYLFSYISDILINFTENTVKAYGELPVVFSGGVMANGFIKNILCEKLNNKLNIRFALPEFSGDNALGTAILSAIKNGEDLWS